jgi:hypothetical protein
MLMIHTKCTEKYKMETKKLFNKYPFFTLFYFYSCFYNKYSKWVRLYIMLIGIYVLNMFSGNE